MDLLGQSALLVGLISFALGISVVAKNVRNKLFISFAALCLTISLWALSFALEKIWGTGASYRTHLVCNVWLAPAALAFIRVMTRIQDTISRRLLDASVFGAMSLTVALVFRLESIPWVLQLIYFMPGIVLIQLLQLMWIDRWLRRGVKRLPKLPTVGFGRRNLIYFGGLLVLMTSVMDHVPWINKGIPVAGNLGLTVYLFFMSQAITQQRLLNFGALLSRFLVLLSVAATLTAVYSLLVAWIENSPGLFVLNSFVASFLILMLLDPLRAGVGYLTQRLLTQKHRRLETLLRDSQRKLAGITDPGTLFQSILLFVEQTLQPEWAALFLLKSDGTKYRRVRMTGVEPTGAPLLREFLGSHPLPEYCDRLRRKGELPVLLDQMIESEIDRSASRTQREALAGLRQGLKALGGNLLIPLFDSGVILGFVVIRAPSPPEPWGSNWGLLSIVYPFYEQAAATLRHMQVFVRQREKERLAALGEMAAGLAHEIRNPLGAIKGAAQFLDPSREGPEARFLRVIVEEVDRLNRVVTQFLDYSKPFAAEMAPVLLLPLIERTAEKLRPGLPQGIKLELTLGAKAHEARVIASAEQLQQILINMVQNSQKALEGRPSATIRISLEVEGEGKNREVLLSVEDNGRGIKREHLDKLFIPFFTTSPSGTGLGLSISQRIVEAHQGRIEVASEEGRFTRFTIILPDEKSFAQEPALP